MAGALEPVGLDARIRLAAKVWAALIEGADIQRRSVASEIFAGDELWSRGVNEHDEGACLLEVDRVALGEWEACVLILQRVEGADLNLAAESALKVWPEEAERPRRHLKEPESEACADRGAHQSASRDPLHLFVA